MLELEADDANSRQRWHNVLLQMLKECRLLRINQIDKANLNLKSNSILETYLELFLSETEKLLHEGLVKKYRKEEANKLAMKGQLLFGQHIVRNLVHKERFYVRFTDYNQTNIFNQLLYKTLCLIPVISSSAQLADKVNRLLLDFPEMPDCIVTSTTFKKLLFDRKTERYKEALKICKMLLLNYRPDITGGSENVIAIVFDMNKLWEEFVFHRLVKSAGEGTRVSRQKKKQFWYNTIDSFYTRVKPDIVITKEGKKVILDTKWKLVDNNRPGDNDLKQMFVYNLLWDADQSILLYPGNHENCKGSFLHFNLSLVRRKSENEAHFNQCSLEFINILDKSGKLVTNDPFLRLLKKL